GGGDVPADRRGGRREERDREAQELDAGRARPAPDRDDEGEARPHARSDPEGRRDQAAVCPADGADHQGPGGPAHEAAPDAGGRSGQGSGAEGRAVSRAVPEVSRRKAGDAREVRGQAHPVDGSESAMEQSRTTSGGRRRTATRISTAALVLAVIGVLVLASAGFGYRFRWWGGRAAFPSLRVSGYAALCVAAGA